MILDDPFALPPVPVPINFNGQNYGNLPPHLAQQLQNLPALPPPLPLRGRGRGRGHNHGYIAPVSLYLCFLS